MAVSAGVCARGDRSPVGWGRARPPRTDACLPLHCKPTSGSLTWGRAIVSRRGRTIACAHDRGIGERVAVLLLLLQWQY